VFFIARILCSNPRRLIRLDQFTSHDARRVEVQLGDSSSEISSERENKFVGRLSNNLALRALRTTDRHPVPGARGNV
jgi:hypothetical protein